MWNEIGRGRLELAPAYCPDGVRVFLQREAGRWYVWMQNEADGRVVIDADPATGRPLLRSLEAAKTWAPVLAGGPRYRYFLGLLPASGKTTAEVYCWECRQRQTQTYDAGCAAFECPHCGTRRSFISQKGVRHDETGRTV